MCCASLLERKGDRVRLRTNGYVITTGSQHRPTSIMRAGIFGAIVAMLAVLPGIWVGTLWDNSETAYSEVAREILRTHDTIVMHMNNQPWFIQPPLYFWVAALSAQIFGICTFAMRLPAVIATIIMGICIATFTTRLAGIRAARYATLALSTMLMQVVIGRLAIMDAMLDALILITILSWARSLLADLDSDDRGSAFIIGSIAAALGILTKGPVALAVPLMVLVPWFILERRTSTVALPARLAWMLGTGVALAILAPWFIMFGLRTGGTGIGELILHYTVGRYLGVIENQPGPWFFYILVFVLGVFPWSGICIAALVDAFKRRDTSVGERTVNDSLRSLSVLWMIIPTVFFSFAQTKLANYIAPVLPGAALLCGLWLDEQMSAKRKSLLVPVVSIPLLSGIMLVAMIVFARKNTFTTELSALWVYAIVFVASIMAAALIAVVLLYRRNLTRYAPLALGAGTLAAMSIAACLALPIAERFKPIPPLAAIIRAQHQPGDIVALQGVNGNNSLMFYTDMPVQALDSPDVPPSSAATNPANVIPAASRVFLVAKTQRPINDPLYGRRRTILAIEGNDTLFLIDTPPAPPQRR